MPVLLTPRPMEPDFPVLPPRVRWRPIDLELNRFWWKRPEVVRILLYLDGGSFLGGGFSLQHVINALESDPWPWVSFEITKAHRGSDQSADHENVTLVDLDLTDYDEVWIFGFSQAASMPADEAAALEAFMDAGGGVLTMGDHDDLGKGMAAGVKRIGRMREYDDPPPGGSDVDRLTTIRDADGDGDFENPEQSDNTPQTIRTRYWYGWQIGGALSGLTKFPHPVLCGERGPLRKLPDHQHEGRVVVPSTFPPSEWPKVGGVQPRPEIIAWGRVLDPDVDTTGTEFGVIGTYDGQRVDVGRIVADSTWHHWFDINLDGFDPLGQDYLDIIAYFQNVAAWLAPAHKQNGMRNGVFWLALHEEAFQQVQLSKLPLALAVKTARDALGRWAPQCLVHSWLIPHIPPPMLDRIVTIDPKGPKLRQPVEDVVLVETMSTLQRHFDIPSGQLAAATSFEMVDAALGGALPLATKRLVGACEDDMKNVLAFQQLVDGPAPAASNGNGSNGTGRRKATSRRRTSAATG